LTVRFVICAALSLVFGGCARRSVDAADADVSGAERQNELSPQRDTQLKRLLEAEALRDVTSVTVADVSSRDVQVRRAATRALARVAVEPSRPLLERALTDEDAEVNAWAAMGLGRLCSGAAVESTIRRILARAATRWLVAPPGAVEASHHALDPWFAMAQALGRCAVPEAERVLRSWLSVNTELARVAVYGLDYYVQATQALEASTIVALVDAADKERRLNLALLPLSRLRTLHPLVAKRLIALTPRWLEAAGDERRYLIRTLPLAGDAALSILERIVVDDGHYHPMERVEAIRAIGKLDAIGQTALGRLVPRLCTRELITNDAFLLSSKWMIVSELFEELIELPKSARADVLKLAMLDSDESQKPAVLRRISHLRCRAASLLSVDDVATPLIERCDDSSDQHEKKLAQLAVLDRLRLRGKAAAVFESLAADSDPLIQINALSVLSRHDEFESAENLIERALASESMGVVANAARFLSGRAQHAKLSLKSSARIAAALERALGKSWPIDAVEVRTSLIDAAGQLGYLSVKPKIVTACAAEVPKLRQSAERALRALGEPNAACSTPPKRALPKELSHLVHKPLTVRFHTDVGPLEIRVDAALAPIAATRFTDLVRAGFYDGVAVHRLIGAFVVQMGDRGRDGFGGAGDAMLPCELSPEAFGPADVGMALSGLDSGSSQFFVSLGPYPQLGGDYTRLGRASVGWEQLFLGDRIQKAEIVP
jgi:cyclophilin family peptidyl-prolyl cis-trans isomerase